jgi:hypothetical protein
MQVSNTEDSMGGPDQHWSSGNVMLIANQPRRQAASSHSFNFSANQENGHALLLKSWLTFATVPARTNRSTVSKRGTSLDKILVAEGDSESQNRLGDSNPVAPSKWLVNVSLADSSREIPLPLSKINADRMGAVEITPVQKTTMGKDVMGQFDERQTGEREVRQVLRGNLLRASDKYGKDGNVVNATMSTGGVEPMLLLPRMTEEAAAIAAIKLWHEFDSGKHLLFSILVRLGLLGETFSFAFALDRTGVPKNCDMGSSAQ